MFSISSLEKRVCFIIILAASIAFAGAAFGVEKDEVLMKRASQILGPLPASMPSEDNPITPEKVKLGHMLFYESRISVDGTVSCFRCHPLSLYGSDGLKKSVGNNCKENPRNDPTVFNAAAQISEHWIGNRTSVEDQAKQALIGPPSYGMPSYEAVESRLRKSSGYAALFRAAFPGDAEPVAVDNFAKAVGAFERTLVTPSPFDAFLKGDANALNAPQKKGLATFIDEGCAGCHFSPYVGGQAYRKFGLFEPYEKYTKSAKVDEGRFVATKSAGDKYVFKVPVLRNAEMTPPYFHDGSVDKLEDAVWIMGKIQLGKELSREQVADLAAFLRSLTGRIPEEVLTVPVLPAM